MKTLLYARTTATASQEKKKEPAKENAQKIKPWKENNAETENATQTAEQKRTTAHKMQKITTQSADNNVNSPNLTYIV